MINLIAPINNLGYGVAGYNIFKSLHSIDPSVALYPIAKPEFVDQYIQAGLSNRYKSCVDKDGTIGKLPSVKIWHQNDIHSHVGKGLHIGFPIFELTEFNDEEILSMKHCDKIFVCSEWAKQIVIDQVNFYHELVHVVPLGVDCDTFNPTKSTRHPTIFFNCGKWEKRKGHDFLLDCFNSAFHPSDDVELWMMCDNPFIGQNNQGWQNLYKSSPMGHKIRIIPRQQSHKDVYHIMAQADCGIFPSRAEGWNLELLEMMACGKHVITTNYSAHTEFCNHQNSYLIEIDKLETAYDGVFFGGSHGGWAHLSEPQKEQTVAHMRTIHENKKANGSALNEAGIETSKRFSWQNSAKEVINGL
tara:strand:- start:376 stop:1449 length:1074 start_codon:yes stop_codon:yes gene_type:complete